MYRHKLKVATLFFIFSVFKVHFCVFSRPVHGTGTQYDPCDQAYSRPTSFFQKYTCVTGGHCLQRSVAFVTM